MLRSPEHSRKITSLVAAALFLATVYIGLHDDLRAVTFMRYHAYALFCKEWSRENASHHQSYYVSTANERQCVELENLLNDARSNGTGEKQCKEDGNAKHHPVTVVTGYYRMSSKASSSSYMKWTKLFLLRVRTPMVVYTDCATLTVQRDFFDVLRERQSQSGMQGSTHVKLMELENTTLAYEVGPIFKKQECQDHELAGGHNYWLYMAWLMKVESLMDASLRNVFCSKWFVWNDIGALRHSEHKFVNWPSLDRLAEIPTDRVLMGLLTPRKGGDAWAHATMGSGRKLTIPSLLQVNSSVYGDHLIGTVIAFHTEHGVLQRFYELLRQTYRQLAAGGHLLVKDQTVYNVLYLLHPELFALVPSRGSSGDRNWRYIHHWLADADERYYQENITVPITLQ